MNRKASVMLSAVLVFTWGHASVAVENPDYLKFSKAKAAWVAKEERLTINLETQQAVPMDGKAGAFGYAVLTNNTHNVLVLVTHLPIDDSSHEQTPSGFHTHVLDLKPPTPACESSTFEVDLPESSKNRAFDANYFWSISGNSIQIKDVPALDLAESGLGDAGVSRLASFTLTPVLYAKPYPTHLCVSLIDQI